MICLKACRTGFSPARAVRPLAYMPGSIAALEVHSADVATITAPTQDKPKADALVTGTSGVALSILTADCQPVLFADPKARVVGAAHAGWKGALYGVLAREHHSRHRPIDFAGGV